MTIFLSLDTLICLIGFAMVVLRVNRIEADIDRTREGMPRAP